MPQLGNEFGTTKQTVFKWENGITVPPLSVVCALADYFNVSLDYLVGRDDVPNRKDYHE